MKRDSVNPQHRQFAIATIETQFTTKRLLHLHHCSHHYSPLQTRQLCSVTRVERRVILSICDINEINDVHTNDRPRAWCNYENAEKRRGDVEKEETNERLFIAKITPKSRAKGSLVGVKDSERMWLGKKGESNAYTIERADLTSSQATLSLSPSRYWCWTKFYSEIPNKFYTVRVHAYTHINTYTQSSPFIRLREPQQSALLFFNLNDPHAHSDARL